MSAASSGTEAVNSAPTVAVAAPPWAAAALAEVAGLAGLGPGLGPEPLPIRHVVVDPRTPETPDTQGVRVLWRYHLTPPQLATVVERLPDLEWVHSDYVGVDDLPLGLMAERGVMLSNGAGISARPMAEWVMLALLLGAKQLPRFVRQSDAAVWDAGAPLGELQNSVVLLLGLGAVGSLVAQMLEPFGAEVHAWTRRQRTTKPQGVTRMLAGDEWRSSVGRADFVVCTLPLTQATAGLLDASFFRSMKPGAWVVNVSRGALIDDRALLSSLDEGHLGGAVLDAFREEPLPGDSLLWRRPDVLVLPHATWSSSHTLEDFTRRFATQLARFVAGNRPTDLVDLAAGY